jgi:hypothetical protein
MSVSEPSHIDRLNAEMDGASGNWLSEVDLTAHTDHERVTNGSPISVSGQSSGILSPASAFHVKRNIRVSGVTLAVKNVNEKAISTRHFRSFH